ncbi:LINE-1 retrotransposable element ORF2 protein [Linum perenne]
MGDYNAIRCPTESSNGCRNLSSMLAFDSWIKSMGWSEHIVQGPWFTWQNGSIARRLDRVLNDDDWQIEFPQSQVLILPPFISDHSGLLLNTDVRLKTLPKSFKFFKMWCSHPSYDHIVQEKWKMAVTGSPLIRICKKLQFIKGELKKLNRRVYSDISNRVIEAELEMTNAQVNVLHDPSPSNLEASAAASAHWSSLKADEESFFRQKARATWITEGDKNTAYFHRSMKARHARNFISVIKKDDGTLCTSLDQIAAEAISFYKNLLGTRDIGVCSQSVSYFEDLFPQRIRKHDAEILIEPVTAAEIRSALFSLGADRSPGPDGFTVHFYRNSWDLIGQEVTEAIQSFYDRCELPFQVNATSITLIPKVLNADNFKNFRPISCCNVLYKCITKVIATRIGRVLPYVISTSQSAFIKGRLISDNILLAHEMVNAYHKKQVSPRCVIKIDLTKAFDSVCWTTLLNVMTALGFPCKMVNWIKICLTTARFSVNINGGSCGYFNAEKGVRQGDPLSPILFVIVMEVLHALLDRVGDLIPFHPRCKKLKIRHVCFADDLLIFTNGSVQGVSAIHQVLHSFYLLTGLKVNPSKTELFCSVSVPRPVINQMVTISGFKEGSLPVKYLGVPLITGSLKDVDCKILVDKITDRIQSWRSNCLSYAGRVQLIESVLYSMCYYWMNVFLLPKKVIKAVQQICAKFLWGTTDSGSANSKVAWDKLSCPKSEGGLGLKDLSSWNRASLARHIWELIVKGGSLWVAWVSYYRTRRKSIWECSPSQNYSWIWNKLLKTRDIIKCFVSFDADGDPIWNGSLMCKFSVSTVWKVLRPEYPVVDWGEMVWKAPSIPRHSFICWLVMLDRLKTRDKLLKWGIHCPSVCVLCNVDAESRDHIFFCCSYSTQVREVCRFPSSPRATCWTEWVNGIKGYAGNGKLSVWFKWRAYIYHIWRERCSRTHGTRVISGTALADIILRDVRSMTGSDKIMRVVSSLYLLSIFLDWLY